MNRITIFCRYVIICPLLAICLTSPLLPEDCTDGTSSTVLKNDEDLLFFPSLAEYNRASGSWRIDVHAWVYEPEMESVKRNALIGLLKKEIGLSERDARSRHFDSMARYLLVDQEGGKDVAVTLGGKNFCIGATNRNGHAQAVISLGDRDMRAVLYRRGKESYIPVTAQIAPARTREIAGAIRVIDENCIMVISDIDDTVKISNVRDTSELLKNTFTEQFRAVPGMARLYRKMAEGGAVFHYVSASPWQLYRPLSAFLAREGFPEGIFCMKSFGLAQNFSSLFADSGSVKMPFITELLARFKGRRFILVGDTGESDPEMYGESARLNPGSVLGIYLRNVTGETRNSARMKKAFRNVPDDRWAIFNSAVDIEKIVLGKMAAAGR